MHSRNLAARGYRRVCQPPPLQVVLQTQNCKAVVHFKVRHHWAMLYISHGGVLAENLSKGDLTTTKTFTWQGQTELMNTLPFQNWKGGRLGVEASPGIKWYPFVRRKQLPETYRNRFDLDWFFSYLTIKSYCCCRSSSCWGWGGDFPVAWSAR